MDDKAFHRGILIVGGIAIIGLIIWLWMHNNAVAASVPYTPAPVYPAGTPGFEVQPYASAPGAVTINASPYNLVSPAALNAGTLVPSSPCDCGCSDNGGPLTISYVVPGIQAALNAIAEAAAATQASIVQQMFNGMAYTEAVYVGNATPTPFSNAFPFLNTLTG